MSWQSPQTWKTATLADICYRIVDGSHNPPTGQPSGKPMLSAKNIQNGKIHFDGLRLLSTDDFELENNRTNISAGDVLLTIVGAIGRTAVVPATAPEFTLQRSVAVLKSNLMNPNYLRYLLDSPAAQSFFLNNAKGTAQKGIYLKALGGMQIPIAPPAEQARIAQKLDELLAQVDTLKCRVDSIPALLKRFRQSVLAAAVSGRLTEDWRHAQAVDPEWKKTAIKSVCSVAFDGPFGSKLKSDDYTSEGVRVVRLENIGHMGFISEKETFISPAKFKELAKNKLEPGDILFSSFVDEEIRVCQLPKSEETFINKADCFCLRIDQTVAKPKFLLYSLAARQTYRQIREAVHGATRPRINLGFLKVFEISLPSTTEQIEIIQRVEQLFAFVSQLEVRVKVAQARIDGLTQSILAKAFRGELVPQDPNDEPASVLLDRIKAQHAAAPKGKRGRRSATAD